MIDENEAPEGYIAVPGWDCLDCAFLMEDHIACQKRRCRDDERKDQTAVIFIKKEIQNV